MSFWLLGYKQSYATYISGISELKDWISKAFLSCFLSELSLDVSDLLSVWRQDISSLGQFISALISSLSQLNYLKSQ